MPSQAHEKPVQCPDCALDLTRWPDAPNCPVCGAKITRAAEINAIQREPTSLKEFLVSMLVVAGIALTLALVWRFYSPGLAVFLGMFLMGSLGTILGVVGLVTRRLIMHGYQITGLGAVIFSVCYSVAGIAIIAFSFVVTKGRL